MVYSYLNHVGFIVALALASCTSGTTDSTSTTDGSTVNTNITEQHLIIGLPSIGAISWSDGDSGRLNDIPFRLRGVDAPETGGVGAAIGGAECEQERELGFLAKEFIETLTVDAAIIVTGNYGPDRFDRKVLDLNADGIDVAMAGVEAGQLRLWPHDDNGNALTSKPDWCQ